MQFMGMIAFGFLGLAACARLFVFMFRIMNRGFDAIEQRTFDGSRKRTQKRRWIDDDDDND